MPTRGAPIVSSYRADLPQAIIPWWISRNGIARVEESVKAEIAAGSPADNFASVPGFGEPLGLSDNEAGEFCSAVQPIFNDPDFLPQGAAALCSYALCHFATGQGGWVERGRSQRCHRGSIESRDFWASGQTSSSSHCEHRDNVIHRFLRCRQRVRLRQYRLGMETRAEGPHRAFPQTPSPGLLKLNGQTPSCCAAPGGEASSASGSRFGRRQSAISPKAERRRLRAMRRSQLV